MFKRYYFHYSAEYQFEPGSIARISSTLSTDYPPSELGWYADVRETIANNFNIDHEIDTSKMIIISLTLLHVEDIE
jgi:hypothetical protein